MRKLKVKFKPTITLRNAASFVVLLVCGVNATAAESYKLRQSPVGMFGGEMAASADNPGFFGTASLTQLEIYKVVDGDGNQIKLPAIAPVQLNPAYKVSFPAGTIDFHQNQTQLNLVGGYLTESTYADGRVAFAVNLPLIKQSRSFIATQPMGTVSPTPASPPLTAPQLGAINAGALQANNKVQSSVADRAARENADVTGVGDTELSLVWVRHQDRLKVAAGVSLFLPTGAYDKNRGPNPGFGNFYTLRPGVAVTYSLNPNHGDAAWDAGVTVAGRLSYGINSRNKDTDYRSGNFVYGEVGVVKVSGNWAYGANLLTTQQVTDDSGTGATLGANRYKTYGVGPFLSYKLPGKDAGFNLQYSDNFGGRNAIVVRSLQVRFVKAW